MKPDYKHIQVKQKTVTANTVKQYYFEVKQKDRLKHYAVLLIVKRYNQELFSVVLKEALMK